MDDDQLKRLLAQVLRLLLSQDEDVLKLIVRVEVLQRRLAEVTATPWSDAKQALESDEQRLLAQLDIAARQKSMRELLDLLERHGGELGKHEA